MELEYSQKHTYWAGERGEMFTLHEADFSLTPEDHTWLPKHHQEYLSTEPGIALEHYQVWSQTHYQHNQKKKKLN